MQHDYIYSQRQENPDLISTGKAPKQLERIGNMTQLFTSLQTAIRQRVDYNRTVSELSQMPLDTALDLDIYRGDIKKIARKAVYG